MNNSGMAAFSTEFPDHGQLDFDARAFFDEYMSTGEPLRSIHASTATAEF